MKSERNSRADGRSRSRSKQETRIKIKEETIDNRAKPEGRNPITLIGEEIAGAWNEAALADIAQVFGGAYLPYDGAQASLAGSETPSILSDYAYLMAAENLPGAQSVYTFRPPCNEKQALLVGNEAKGLRRRTWKQAHGVIEIPLPSRNINCLNVAAAAAVMLYFLSQEQPLNSRQRSTSSLHKHRPELLLIGDTDPMELGGTIRSTCAFGWEHLFLEDRGSAWYECDRRIKSEGRGAARRGRNPIKVIPHQAQHLTDYSRMAVFTSHACGRPPHQLPLTGNDLLIVLPDEKSSSFPWSPPSSWNGELTYASLPQMSFDRYHYRQMSAIALAEIARQLGTPPANGIYLKGKKDRYRRSMEAVAVGTLLDLEALRIF